MKKIALVVILALVIGGFGLNGFLVPKKARAEVADPGFNFTKSIFRFVDKDSQTIEHIVPYKDGSNFRMLYKVQWAAKGRVWSVKYGLSFTNIDDIRVYQRFKYMDNKGKEWHSLASTDFYFLAILEASPDKTLKFPKAMILATPTEGPFDEIRLDANDKTYKSAKGGTVSDYAWYIKGTADYLEKYNTERDNTTILDFSPDLLPLERQELEKAKKKCSNELFIKEITSSETLPGDFSELISQIDPKGLIYQNKEDFIKVIKASDQRLYQIFYSSGQEEGVSDRHFTNDSSAKTEFQDMDAKFSVEFSDYAKDEGLEEVDLVAGGAAALLTYALTGREILAAAGGAATGLGVVAARDKLKEFFSGGPAKEYLAKMITAKYYVDKHLEYHQCVLDELSFKLPSSHPFSSEKLADERDTFKRIIDESLAEDVDSLDKYGGNDCKFDFFDNQTINNVMCSFYKLIGGAAISFAKMSYDFFLEQLTGAGSSSSVNSTNSD